MNVRVMVKRLSPGMEHGEDAGLRTEVLRVRSDLAQSLGRRLEQDGIDHLLVLERDLRRQRRQGEHDMEVRYRQEFARACGKPLFPCRTLTLRAMPVAAGVVSDADGAAILALLGMPAERRGPAELDRAHHPTLDPAKVTGVSQAIGLAVAAEDIRHLQ